MTYISKWFQKATWEAIQAERLKAVPKLGCCGVTVEEGDLEPFQDLVLSGRLGEVQRPQAFSFSNQGILRLRRC
jgi:hypothetical protein